MSSATGPEQGGTVLSVIGGESNLIFCVVGAFLARAWSVNSTLAQCTMPPAPSGMVNIQMLYDSEDTVVGTNFSFTYLPLARMSISPNVGPAFGGEYVLVRGVNLMVRNLATEATGMDVHCRFGSSSLQATVVNATAVACLSPISYPQRVPVDITVNGQSYISTGTNSVFFDVVGFTLLQVWPRMGSTTGAMRQQQPQSFTETSR